MGSPIHCGLATAVMSIIQVSQSSHQEPRPDLTEAPESLRPRQRVAKGARRAALCGDLSRLKKCTSKGAGATAKTHGHSHSSMLDLVVSNPMFDGIKQAIAGYARVLLVACLEFSEGLWRETGATLMQKCEP